MAEQCFIQHADTCGCESAISGHFNYFNLSVAEGVRVTKMITNDSRAVCAVFCQGSGRAPHISRLVDPPNFELKIQLKFLDLYPVIYVKQKTFIFFLHQS